MAFHRHFWHLPLLLSLHAPPHPPPGCDECIWHLIGDLRLSNKTLDQLKVSVLNISTGAAANDRLKYYNYTALRLQVKPP